VKVFGKKRSVLGTDSVFGQTKKWMPVPGRIQKNRRTVLGITKYGKANEGGLKPCQQKR
jgi:hypothetical protein